MIYNDVNLIPPATAIPNGTITLRASDGSTYTARSTSLAWVPVSAIICAGTGSFPTPASCLPGLLALDSTSSYAVYVNTGSAWTAAGGTGGGGGLTASQVLALVSMGA